VADHYDTERDGVIDQNDLDRLQGKEGEVDPNELDTVAPNFWWDEPKHLLQVLRFAMFQFSVTLAEVVFYSWQVSHACYFQARGAAIWVVLMVVVFACVLLGVVTVPLYSLVSTTTHHDHDVKHPDRKPLKKKLATHKAVLHADMILLKVALGLEKEAPADDGPAGDQGWKATMREKKKAKVKVHSDPVKQAEIDAKKKIRGTFEWAIHMNQLEARIKLAREELQSAQRIKSMSKEEQKAQIAEAKQAAKLKVKANQVAPSPESSPRGSETGGGGADETSPLKHTGDLPPVAGSTADVEHGHGHGDDEHGHGDDAHGHGDDEHGHGHGHHAEKCCGKELPMPVFAAAHIIGILIAFALFSTIPKWHHYAAETPGAHWKYEGANGPEWWGSIKEQWAICSVGENGTTWGMQSPIDLNLNVWNGVGDGSNLATGFCSIPAHTTKALCEAATPAAGVWTGTGYNEVVNRPNDLQVEIDTDGYFFNPTQEHGSPRFDCGTQGDKATSGACGKLRWTAPGRCLETSVTATKHAVGGRVSVPADAEACFAATSEAACTATALSSKCTWHAQSQAEEYNVQSFSFHTPSEHLVNGNKYAMELQIVTCTGECALDTDMSYFAADGAATEDPDKFAIYSVLFEAGDASSPAALAVAKMFEYIKRDCPQNRDKFGACHAPPPHKHKHVHKHTRAHEGSC